MDNGVKFVPLHSSLQCPKTKDMLQKFKTYEMQNQIGNLPSYPYLVNKLFLENCPINSK